MSAEPAVPAAPVVLYVGSGPVDRDGIEVPLGRMGLACVTVDSRQGITDALLRRSFGVCLIDLAGNGHAIRTARKISADYPGTVLIGLADPARPDRTVEAMRAGFIDVFARPLGARDVEAIAAHARERAAIPAGRDERTARPFSVDLLGHSPPIRGLMELIPRVARSRSSVVICAEQGIDAEALARELHARSERAGGPFQVFACGVDDPVRLEQELFGRVGAPREANGPERIAGTSRLGAARGGTLFLSHLEELPASAQARLARIARDGEVRLDEDEPAVPLDVRVIASTGRPLEDSVAEGHVRADLAQRLGVVRLDPPPLRERAEDIPLLCQYFAVELCAAAGEGLKTFTQAALTVLSALPWPGNTAELRSVLERLVAHTPAPVIRLEDVLAHIRLDTVRPLPAARSGSTLREARLRFEKDYIAAVLQQHGWRMSDAARALGIQRTNLYRKARQLHIPRSGRGDIA
jgi:two-component system, NtrC family, nitrogen regulation response regulator NtrX